MQSQLSNQHSSQSSLSRKEGNYIYEVLDDKGNRFRHCGTIKDVECVLSIYPDYTYYKLYLPAPPATIDVPHIRVAQDLELPMQQQLPESQAQPLDL